MVSKITSTISGRYGAYEVDLEGTANAWMDLGNSILNNTQEFLEVYLAPSDSLGPFKGSLTTITFIFQEEKDKLDISRDDTKLVIVGSSENQQILAQNILTLSKEQPRAAPLRSHIHIEYFPEHFYLAPSALPLILTLV